MSLQKYVINHRPKLVSKHRIKIDTLIIILKTKLHFSILILITLRRY